jgi:hypothetical protein
MAAAVAGLMTSTMTTIGRHLMGYTYYDRELSLWIYKRGLRNLYPDL